MSSRPHDERSEHLDHANDDQVMRRLLSTPGTWAVVGLSANRNRTAYGIAAFLQSELGQQLIPIHPRTEVVHGEQGYAALDQIPDDRSVDVVDCFVNSDDVGAVVDQAIEHKDRLGISAVWLQLGVIDQDAARRAKQAGLDVVMDTCPKLEYPRLRI